MNTNITDEYITNEQKELMLEIMKFSPYSLPPISLENSSKREASEWISKNWKIAYETGKKLGFY